jgi:hypothetical protein
MNELTQQGVAALKSGDRAAARQYLTDAIKQDANDVLAWLWLTGALDNDDERMACLRQVLKLDPENQAAARGLAKIMENRASQPAQIQTEAIPVVEPTAPATQMEPELETAPVAPTQAFPPVPVEQVQESAPTVASGTDEAAPAEVETAAWAATPASETSAGVTSEPLPEQPLPGPSAAPAEANARIIFRTRPSLIPALVCFWLFLFGAAVVAFLLIDIPEVGLPLAVGLGLILEIVVIYVVIRSLAVRYELTSQQLTLRSRGKRARIRLTDIYHAELTQSFMQRLVGIGNVEIDAAVDGQLAHLQLRNIPRCRQRTEQLLYLVRDHASA